MATTASTPPAAADQQGPDKAAEKAWTDLVKKATTGDTAGSRQVKRALQLESDRASLMKRIADNREYLRLMDRNEELSDEQATFLDTFYPEKEKGERRSQDEIDATRKAREFARKVASA